MTLHPASHNILMDIRDACAKLGTMRASFASFGSHGMSSLQVCIDVRQPPCLCGFFGNFIVIVVGSCCLWSSGVVCEW